MENTLGNFDGTAFLNRFLSTMADILSEQSDVNVTIVARPKTDEEKRPA